MGGVPLYTEVSSFQEVGIEEFRCIQSPQGVNRGIYKEIPLCTEVSSLQGGWVPLYFILHSVLI